jgi:hypothetical protein
MRLFDDCQKLTVPFLQTEWAALHITICNTDVVFVEKQLKLAKIYPQIVTQPVLEN